MRTLFWTLLGVYFLIAVTVGVLRMVVLPNVHQYRERIAGQLEKAIGERVALGDVTADWSGFHPRLSIVDFKLYDDRGDVALELPRIAATISWRSLIAAELTFSDITIEGPALAIRRDAQGHLFVAGMEIKPDQGNGQGFSDWLLRQGEVVISHGRVEWKDDRRAAPALALENVAFRLQNGIGASHAFALAATPPPWLASKIDVRGRLYGDLFRETDHWNGDLYAHFSYTDLAGWAPWVEYPFAVRTGRGGLTMWLTLEDSRITEAIADVALEDVRMRLSQQLPPLELARLHGRVTALETTVGPRFLSFFWRSAAGYKVAAEEVSMQSMAGPSMDHVRFAVEWSNHPEAKVAQGTAAISALDVGTLATLAEAIPLPKQGREFLSSTSPHGVISDITASWSGNFDAPNRYRFAANFSELGMKPSRQAPGFDHLNGNVELSETGGHLAGVGKQVELDFPDIFPQHARQIWDQLGFDVNWTAEDGDRPLEVRMTRAELANADLAATAKGLWRAVPHSPGYLDLDVTVPRADGRSVYHYIPQLDEGTAHWLVESIMAGDCTQGQVHVRGDLAKFPFEEKPGGATDGEFTVSARVADAMLRPHPQWPVIERINGLLTVRGSQLTFAASQGFSRGGRIIDTTARVSGLAGHGPILDVTGRAEGDTADFLRLIADSPLNNFVGVDATAFKTEGRGRLDLKLTIPLAHASDLKVNGGYQLINNRLSFAGNQPPLSQLNGRFDFTERNVSARATAQLLGGPTNLTLASRGDEGVAIAAQGSANLQTIGQIYPFPYADQVHGQAAYSANLFIRPRGLQLAVESNLQGVTIDLPPPLAKTAEEAISFRLDDEIAGGGDVASERHVLSVSAGRLLSVIARFRDNGSGLGLERAAIGLGEAKPALPERNVVAVAAAFKTIDVDRFLPAFTQRDNVERPGVPLAEISLQSPEMIVFGRRLSNVSVRAEPLAASWSIRIRSDQASGDLTWKSDGHGQVTGHFAHLEVPEAVSGSAGGRTTRDLPAMDVTANSFFLAHHDVGQLMLVALNRAQGWEITHFSLTAAEGTTRGEGLWQTTGATDHFDADFSVESSDAGKYLARLGQPGAVKGAKAEMKGHVSWNGPPYSVDYPSLAGHLSLHAERGQFLQADPGVGRLLGVLSLQSIPRRISLDFQDVFSEGFSFDQIEATGTIEHGILSIVDFRMAGPAAAVSLSGQLDLSRETQNLRAHIVPVIGDGIAAAAGLALLNPVVGLGTLIAQRLLRDPLGKLFAYEYDVTGAWSNPKVSRAGARPLGVTGGTPGDPATMEPASTEPATSEPATAQPAGAQPAGVEPPTAQPAGVGMPSAQPAGVEPPTARPAGVAPPSAPPAGAEPPSTQPANAGPGTPGSSTPQTEAGR